MKKDIVSETKFTLRLPVNLADKLTDLAKRKNISRSELIEIILESYISNTLFSDYESRYQDLLRKCTTVIGANSHAFETLTEIISGGEEDEYEQ